MSTRVKSIIVAGGFTIAALAFGAAAFTASAQAGVGGAAGVAKKSVAGKSIGIKARPVHFARPCRPAFRRHWTPRGWRRVFAGRRCWRRPHRHYGYYRPYGPRWHRHRHRHRHGWRRGGGPRIVLRLGW